MPTFNPVKLATWSSGRWEGGMPSDDELSGFCIDTRKTKSGDIFIAIQTGRRDGHDFLGDAKEQGAVAALVERFIPGADLPQLVVNNTVNGLLDIAHGHRLEFRGTVVGITGSCGKTSTKDALALLLGDTVTCKTEANLNNLLGLSLTLLKLDNTIHKYAVVEAGISEPGEMDRLARALEPDIGILTIVGSAHTEGLGGLEEVASEKAKLLRAVRNGGIALFPEECLQYGTFEKPLDNPLILCFERNGEISKNKLAFCWEFVTNTRDNGQITVRNDCIGTHQFDLPDTPLGQGMARNIAMSLGVALRLGIDPEKIQSRLLKWEPSPLRGEVRTYGKQTFYVDCYNANPVSMEEAVRTFSIRFQNQPKLYVMGTMNELGEDSKEQHKKTGRGICLGEGDRAVLIGGQAGAYREGMLEAGADANRITVVVDAMEALPLVRGFEGAILLKGSRSYGLERLLDGMGANVEETNGERRLAAAC
jgi:UDP-N-acetylmuramoyl-tripeptide--D-alanyl-D-alanine ligase